MNYSGKLMFISTHCAKRPDYTSGRLRCQTDITPASQRKDW